MQKREVNLRRTFRKSAYSYSLYISAYVMFQIDQIDQTDRC
jgi:hypothetical protein